jgi:two-component system response regulator MprA
VSAGWPDGAIVHDNTLDQYVAKVRRKLARVDDSRTITTVHGVGYRFT